MLYMCLLDGGPLTEGDRPLVFEDVDEAHEALIAAGEEEAIVAEIAPEKIAQRLQEAQILRSALQADRRARAGARD